ncbi:excalibur calcium-binding domain-containing protein [Sporosarcina sp. ACRSM]|uniref:excalibur calcium-binding domain-containing protein n=1 Tax=Sporosarcina sp. ACRSM TaxID=2918216 RepID=UPI001EF6AFC3|nr:excalibur calcium-binding domain-containing protein [Sporosarcina sp. ACRSM]MCG7337105.1 excalibur calcium-binding domain-containing protein [Sporosarcina sp. ACRSM]
MKRLFTVVLSFTLVFSLSFYTTQVEAASPKTKTYANCKELNKVYPGGVARSASIKNKGGKTKYKPFVSQALYDTNKKSDRDKDLIACER